MVSVPDKGEKLLFDLPNAIANLQNLREGLSQVVPVVVKDLKQKETNVQKEESVDDGKFNEEPWERFMKKMEIRTENYKQVSKRGEEFNYKTYMKEKETEKRC